MIDEGKKPNKKPLIYYYTIALIVLMLLNALLFPSLLQTRVTEVSYSDFLQMVDEGEVTEVAIEEDEEQILFMTGSEEEGNAVYYKTGIFPDDSLVTRLDPARTVLLPYAAPAANREASLREFHVVGLQTLKRGSGT